MNVVLIIFAYLTLFVFGLIDNSRGPTYPHILSFFNLSKSTGSLMFSLSSGFAFIMTLVSNKIFRKFGVNNSVKAAVFLMVLAPLFYGYFSRFEDGFYPFLIGSFILGTSVGILSVGINLILSRNTNDSNRQKLFSGLHSMYGLASFGAPLLLSFILSFGISWQDYYLILAIFPFLLLLWSTRIKNDVFDEKSSSLKKLSFKATIPLGILLSFYVCSEILMSTRMVIFLSESWGLDQAHSSKYLSYFFLLLLLGRFSFAFINFRISSANLLKISSISTLVILSLGTFVSPDFLPLVGLTMSYFFPCALGWLSSLYPDYIDTLIPNVMKFVNGMIVIIHGVFGIVSDGFGIKLAFSLAIVFQLIVLFLLFRHRSSNNSAIELNTV